MKLPHMKCYPKNLHRAYFFLSNLQLNYGACSLNNDWVGNVYTVDVYALCPDLPDHLGKTHQ